MSAKDIVKLLLPPLVVRWAHSAVGHSKGAPGCLLGNYKNWDDALRDSSGYDSSAILEKTAEALMKVKNGEAVYERDSVLFNEPQYEWELLANLMWIAAQHEGILDVLDFGGSLGSTYFQNRTYLSSLKKVTWRIVEQHKYVEVGKKLFEDQNLKFFYNIPECLKSGTPNMVFLGSVLQYLKSPYSVLKELQDVNCDVIMIDRTPFFDSQHDRLCVQKVPGTIYPGSYPSWIFSRANFMSKLGPEWEIQVEFENSDKMPGPVDFNYKGMILVRKDARKSTRRKI